MSGPAECHGQDQFKVRYAMWKSLGIAIQRLGREGPGLRSRFRHGVTFPPESRLDTM